MRLDDPTARLIVASREQPGPRVLRAEDVYAHPMLIESEVPICDWALRLYPPQFVDRAIPNLTRRGQLDSSTSTVARIEEGHWIAKCPFCPSAQRVTPLDPRFICAGLDGCLNAPIRGAYATVIFPSTQKQAAIESVLLERPARLNRNWLPGETVADLVVENQMMLPETGGVVDGVDNS
jgi:hypothetical protein